MAKQTRIAFLRSIGQDAVMRQDSQLVAPMGGVSLSRRRFLAKGGGIVGGAASLSLGLAAGAAVQPELLVERGTVPGMAASRQKAGVLLGDVLVWEIDPSLFVGDPILQHTVSADGAFHTLRLRHARYPGTSFRADFYAELYRSGGRWKLRVSFLEVGLALEHDLVAWGEGRQSYEGELLGDERIVRFGAGRTWLSPAKGELSVRIDHGFAATFSGAEGMVFGCPRLDFMLGEVLLRPLLVTELPASQHLVGKGPYAETVLSAARPFDGDKFDNEIYVSRVGTGQKAWLAPSSLQTGSILSYGDGERADGFLHLGEGKSAGTLVLRDGANGPLGTRLQLESWSLTGFLGNVHKEASFSARLSTAKAGHAAEGDRLGLVLKGKGDTFTYELTDRALQELTVSAELLCAHVALPGASAANLVFDAAMPITVVFGGKPDKLDFPVDHATWRIGKRDTWFAAPLEPAKLEVRRTIDGFDLSFGFRDYCVTVDADGTRITARPALPGAVDRAYQPRLLVHFPPQHEFEEVFSDDRPSALKRLAGTLRTMAAKPDPFQGKDKARPADPKWRPIDDTKGPEVARTRIAEPSRLVFEAPARTGVAQPPQFVPLSIDWLTNWDGLALVVSPRALPRTATLDEQIALAGIEATEERSTALAKVAKLLQPPAPDETAIEPVYRMIVSPDPAARFSTPRGIPDPRHPILWSAQLASNAGTAVRVLWARGMEANSLHASSGTAPFERDFVGSLNANDRRELAEMQSLYGLPALRRLIPVNRDGGGSGAGTTSCDAQAWHDDPSGMVFMPTVPHHYLDHRTKCGYPQEGVMLARPFQEFRLGLGRAADMDARWRGEPPAPFTEATSVAFTPAFTVESYSHRTVQGRDVHVEVIYKGFLFPLGIRAALVKVSYRDYLPYQNARNGPPTAYLLQRMFIVCNKPQKTYRAYGQPNDSRDFPCDELTMLTVQTGNLRQPERMAGLDKNLAHDPTREIQGADKNPANVFWPKLLSGEDVMFSYRIDGQAEPVRSRLLFVDNAAAHDPVTVKRIMECYRLEAPDYRKAWHDGAVRRYARENRKGECSFKTFEWQLDAQPRRAAGNGDGDYHMDAFMEGLDQPPFYPVLARATVAIEPVERLTGRAGLQIECAFNANYVSHGFDAAKNPSELYLDIHKPDLYLDGTASDGATGGVASMAALLAAMSRKVGPVGGRKRQKDQANLLKDSQVEAGYDKRGAEEGRFDPLEFLGGALNDAKLLGCIPLKDVLRAALIGAAPQLMEQVEYGAAMAEGEFEAFKASMRAVASSAKVALTAARGEIDRRIVEVFGEKAALPDLYPEFHASLMAVETAIASAESGLDAGTAAFSQLQADLRLLLRAIEELLRALEALARDPVPVVIKTQLDKIRTGWATLSAAFRDPKQAVEQLLGTLLKIAIDDIATSWCASDQADFVTALFGEYGTGTGPAADAQSCERLKRLLASPADIPARLEESLYAELFGKPLLQVLQALQQAKGIETGHWLPWSRQAVVRIVAGVVRRQAQAIAEESFRELGEYLAGRIADTLAANAPDLDSIGGTLDRLIREPGFQALADRIAGDVLHSANCQLADARSRIDEILRKESLPAPPPGLDALYQDAMVALRRAEDLMQAARHLQQVLAGDVEQVRKAILTEVENEFRRAFEEQRKALEAAAHKAADDATRRITALLGDATSLIENWHALHAAAKAANQLCAANLKDLENALNGLSFGFIGAEAQLRAALQPVDRALLEARSLLGAMAWPSDADTRVRSALDAAVTVMMREHMAIHAGIDELVALHARWTAAMAQLSCASIPAGLAGMLGQLGTLRARLARSIAMTISAAVDVFNSAGYASGKLGASTNVVAKRSDDELLALRRKLNEAAAALIDVLRLGTGLVSRAGGLDWTQVATSLTRFVPSEASNVQAIVSGIDAIAAKLADPGAGAMVGGAKSLADAALVVVESGLNRLARVAGPAIVPAGFLDRLDRAIRDIGNALGGLLYPACRAAATPITDLIGFLKDAKWRALAAVLDQQISRDLLDADTALSEDQGMAATLRDATTGVDAYNAAKAIADKWKGRPPGLVLALHVFGRVVEVLSSGSLASLVSVDRLIQALKEAIKDMLPTKVSLNYAFDTELGDFPASDPIFLMDRANYGGPAETAFWEEAKMPPPGNDLVLRTRVEIDVLSGRRSVDTVGQMRSFTLNLLGSNLDLIGISFAGAQFKAAPGAGFSFVTRVSDVRVGALLSFLTVIQSYFSSGDDNGVYYDAVFGPPALEVGYRYNEPLIQVGSLQLINIGFKVGALLPLDDRPAEFFAQLSSRELPFLIAQPPYGGGGFFRLRANVRGIISFEIQLEFGFVGALSFGPLNASVRATVGIYLMSGPGTRVLEGFFHAIGEGHIACFGIAVAIEIKTRQEDDGAMAGSASYSYSFKIGWFKVKYSVTAGHRQEGSKGQGGGKERSAALREDAGTLALTCGPGATATATTKARTKEEALSLRPQLRSKALDKQSQWKRYRAHVDI